MIHPILVFLRLLCLLPLGYSARVDFKRVPTLHGGERLATSFFLDDSGVAERTARGRGGRSVGLKNVNDVLYVANVTVGGQDYVLQVSTMLHELVQMGVSFLPSLIVARRTLSFPPLFHISQNQYAFC